MDTNRHNSHKLPCIPNRLVFGVALGLRIDSRIEVFTHTWFASAILNLKRKNNLRNLALCSYQCSLILRPCGGEGDRYGTSCKETSFLVIFALLLFSFYSFAEMTFEIADRRPPRCFFAPPTAII